MSPHDFQLRHCEVIADVAEYHVDGVPTIDFVGHCRRRFAVQLPGGWASYPDPAALYEPALRFFRPGPTVPVAPAQRDFAARSWAARQARSLAVVLEQMTHPSPQLPAGVA